MSFQICDNTGFFLRMGILGPSGAGKTYTAIKLATLLGCERIGVIDTENRSARRYARSFEQRFMSMELTNFAPRDYIDAIKQAQAAHIDVLVIDSLSHAWAGAGGVLDMVDQATKRQRNSGGNSFASWREVTPQHNYLVDTMLQAHMHLIVTMRVKVDYIIEENAQGKKVPRKIGLAPIQREGLDYEFDIIGEMTLEHDLIITKTRCSALSSRVFNCPSDDVAALIRTWLNGASPSPVAAPPDVPADVGHPLDDGVLTASAIDLLRNCNTMADLDGVRAAINARRPKGKEHVDAIRAEIEKTRLRLTGLAEIIASASDRPRGPEGYSND